jgi:hypothetical protein
MIKRRPGKIKQRLKCWFGFHQMQECSCGTSQMCIWCYKLIGECVDR